MKAGERVLVYHTGDEKAVIGEAEVVREAYPDPKYPEGKLLVVDIEARGRLARPVTLAEIKALAEFRTSPLVKQGRLSVVPLTAAQWKAIEARARA
jgi:predicted RNA-binding protein with PUA-like domain